MKERPILFSAPMVRALLDGRKTQTRRAIKPQPVQEEWLSRCPYGVPGDRLWVKETHAVNVPGCERGLSYRADHQDPKGDGPANPMRWIPSIHMRRVYSRLTLEVTEVRVERVQDISETDAIAEGVEQVVAPVLSFRTLWHSINGAESWAANPYVWVVGFRVVT